MWYLLASYLGMNIAESSSRAFRSGCDAAKLRLGLKKYHILALRYSCMFR
jgi:hypothetical protein